MCLAIAAQEISARFRVGFPRTVHFLKSRGAQIDVAEEVAQAAWTVAWERREELRKPEMAVAWVNSIAKNMLTAFARSASRHAQLDESMARPDGNVTKRLQRLDLDSAIAADEDPIVGKMLWMFYADGHPTLHIAQELGLSPAAVRIQMCRGRQRLRRRLNGSTGPASVNVRKNRTSANRLQLSQHVSPH